ncbi:class I SAM-dependent DNA methyltransferase [Flavobacterium oreochromis]|uniref:SAM-dependent methyltransferase n=1 Tax=Flavobacterium columnare TaxID=996 RepID=A0A246GCG9_9FLAO|nr:class I SAM-dependent methyltransferase [Flavobacterium oreochromis]OWP77062.1 SAM-dependent methyltransferase [Flavobacterium oreochromis]
MISLYQGEMAEIYDIMYQSFINYNEEYIFYKKILDQYNCHNTLEIGAGTGHLANQFILDNFNYIGLDYSSDMLNKAKKRCPKAKFINADMRSFNLEKRLDSIIMTGRTSSYIITNKDFKQTLTSIHSNLKPKQYLIFDFIDANRYLPYILKNKNIEHKANHNNKKYTRIGNWYPTDLDNFLLKWEANYYDETTTPRKLIQYDTSIVRIFTKEEISLHLQLNNFKIIEFIDRKTYAYDTFVVIAQKIT